MAKGIHYIRINITTIINNTKQTYNCPQNAGTQFSKSKGVSVKQLWKGGTSYITAYDM